MPQQDHISPRARGRRMATWTVVTVMAVLALSGCELGELKDGYLPRGVTENSERVRTLWIGSWIALLAVGVLVWGLTAWCVVAYRRRRDDNELPVQLRYNVPLEILYTIVPILMVAAIFGKTVQVENSILEVREDPDVVVNVAGKMWSWDFNYVNEDVYISGTQAANLKYGEEGVP